MPLSHANGSAVVSFELHADRSVWRITDATIERYGVMVPVERLDAPHVLDASVQAARLAGAAGAAVLSAYGVPMEGGAVRVYAVVALISLQ